MNGPGWQVALIPMPISRVVVTLSGAILLLAAFANWPREVSSIKPGIEQAGFPQVFAIWRDERLESFHLAALLIDIAIPLLAVTVPFSPR